jgi:hypothetical protein
MDDTLISGDVKSAMFFPHHPFMLQFFYKIMITLFFIFCIYIIVTFWRAHT